VNIEGAFAQSQQLNQGWVGTEHILLALLAEPNAASEVLGGLGVTHERLKAHITTLKPDPDDPVPKAGTVPGMTPAAYGLMGWATGFAAAAGVSSPRPEHWLIAFLYASDRGTIWLNPFGVTAKAVTDALAIRGVRVPEFPAPEHQPWRGGHMMYVSMRELQPIIDVLSEKHPPGSEWKWGYNMVGKPQRGRVHAEEGIDLAAVVTQARDRIKAKAKPSRKTSR
jgi:ATP-dependent Clp protease ATP-binding subunit ClpA